MKRILVTTSAILSFAILGFANPGDLDLTFNGTGKAATNFGSGTAIARDVAVQPDGKIVIPGYYQETGVTAIAVTRYDSNGSLDTSFDGDGRVTTAITNNSLFVFAVAVQNDGKIVVAGTSSQSAYFVARYNVDGSPDLDFDVDGIAFTPFISSTTGSGVKAALAIQTDGKIVVAGSGFFSGSGYDFCVARFNPNGSLDNSFDSDGVVNTSISPNWDYANAVAIQTDGKIVVAGQSRNDTDGWDELSIVRYNTDGSLDTSFDGDGILTTAIGTVGARNGSDAANSVAFQSDNQIVVAGIFGQNTNFAIVRYNANGSLDTTFDLDGKVTTTLGNNSNDQANSLAIQADGKIIAAGSSTSVTGNVDFAVVRYNSDGSLDDSFANGNPSNVYGNGGKVLVDFSGANDVAYGAKIDSSGRLIATGSTGSMFGTVRLQGLAPTAASVSIAGRVRTSDGRGLSNAIVYLTNTAGITRTTRTSSFGYYRFEEIESGQSVVLGVSSKRYQFEPRVLSISEELTDVDFVPIGGDSILK
jgi:uncharacterized delta-60 repeat protein